jgi:hypothetical protein
VGGISERQRLFDGIDDGICDLMASERMTAVLPCGNFQTGVAMLASKEDLGIDPSQLNGSGVIDYLDRRIRETLQEIESSDGWREITDPQTDPKLVAEAMKEVYLEIVLYQPDAIEAAIAIIGQMPRQVPAATIAEMLHHQAEEFDHGEMALRDYVALGGSEVEARSRRMTPTAFHVAGTWRMLQHKRDPFAYLGALYPFEGLTPIVTDRIRGFLRDKGMASDSLAFVDYHATADLEHTRVVRELISSVADDFLESRESICYGINYFLAVYPLPGWNAAFHRAKVRLRKT